MEHVTEANTPSIETMSDRALLEECVRRMRQTEEMVGTFINAMQNNPMFRMMAGKMMGQ